MAMLCPFAVCPAPDPGIDGQKTKESRVNWLLILFIIVVVQSFPTRTFTVSPPLFQMAEPVAETGIDAQPARKPAGVQLHMGRLPVGDRINSP